MGLIGSTVHVPLVSVIIPVYDIEAYVGDAICSVIRQTLSDWELICIDDGSHDGSLEICREFATADARITVVEQEHAGLGAARNHGVLLARGRYVYFLDGDDMIEPGALELCTRVAEENGSDLVLFGARVLVEDGSPHNERFYIRSREYPGVWSGADLYVAQRRAGDYRSQACLYLTRRDLLLGCKGSGSGAVDGTDAAQVNAMDTACVFAGIFPLGVIHEDESGTFLLLMRAQRVVCLPDLLYLRRYRPGSIMTQRNWRASTEGYFRAYATAYDCRLKDDAADSLRAQAYRLHLDSQASNCIASFNRTEESIDRFSSVCGARVEDSAALASLLVRKDFVRES
ncbi:MAG: glycosyltransferase family 2 protein [Eggerthellaceae bacterium]|nr:glycosyltransferase family 2 protein [Eggerthellaceae bacterium]